MGMSTGLYLAFRGVYETCGRFLSFVVLNTAARCLFGRGAKPELEIKKREADRFPSFGQMARAQTTRTSNCNRFSRQKVTISSKKRWPMAASFLSPTPRTPSRAVGVLGRRRAMSRSVESFHSMPSPI